jgi:hypothetical protein
MPTTIPVDSDFQRLVVEQALAREMESTAAAALQGKVLHQCEGLLLTRGREFLLRTLQAMAQHMADEVVKKMFARSCAYGHLLRHKGSASRSVMTALESITVKRVSFTCFACSLGSTSRRSPAVGLDGYLTTQELRLGCLAGGQRSFANGELLLKELCGWHFSDEGFRRPATPRRIKSQRGVPSNPLCREPRVRPTSSRSTRPR